MNNRAFTLLEVLTVVLIIAILTAISVPQYQKVVEKGRFARAEVMAKALYDSCERLVAEWGVDEWGDIDSSARKLSRLDIGEDSLLPVGFSLDNAASTIAGAGFSYTLRNTGACFVNITKTAEPFVGVSLTFGRPNNGAAGAPEFTCSGNATACSIYGLD